MAAPAASVVAPAGLQTMLPTLPAEAEGRQTGACAVVALAALVQVSVRPV